MNLIINHNNKNYKLSNVSASHAYLLQSKVIDIGAFLNQTEQYGITTEEIDGISLYGKKTDDQIAIDNDNCLQTIEQRDSKDPTDSENQKSEINSKNNSKLNTDQNRQLTCEICVPKMIKMFDSMPNLELHMSKFHRMPTNYRQCEQCGKNLKWYSYDQLNHHITERHTKPKCKICQKTYSCKKSLDVHYRTHTGEKPYKCQICDKCFSGKTGLNHHTQTHTGKKSVKCELCSELFSRNFSLIRHMRSKHACETETLTADENKHLYNHIKIHNTTKKKESYKCEYCDKYISKDAFVLHTRTHTGEKPYACEYCGKTFSSQSRLTNHATIHTGEKPYKCKYCDKFFRLQSTLFVHTKIHTEIVTGEKPYKCEYCPKHFSNNTKLLSHTKYHIGEKSYKCKYCVKSFLNNYLLTRHTKSHTGEKPYKCEICEKSFSEKTTLTKHLLSITHMLQNQIIVNIEPS